MFGLTSREFSQARRRRSNPIDILLDPIGSLETIQTVIETRPPYATREMKRMPLGLKREKAMPILTMSPIPASTPVDGRE